MALIAVGSAKGGAGATTLAVGLAARWSVPGDRETVLLEADRLGGDLELDFRGQVEAGSGLVAFAAAAQRGGVNADLLRAHARALPSGVRTVHAPVAAEHAAVALEALELLWRPDQFGDLLVVADLGAVGGTGPTGLTAHADVVVLVSGGNRAQLTHTADVVGRITAPAVVVAVTGPCPYSTEEITRHLGAKECVRLPHDPLSAAVMHGAAMPGRSSRWRQAPRLELLGAARDLRARLDAYLPPLAASERTAPKAAKTTAEPASLAGAMATLER